LYYLRRNLYDSLRRSSLSIYGVYTYTHTCTPSVSYLMVKNECRCVFDSLICYTYHYYPIVHGLNSSLMPRGSKYTGFILIPKIQLLSLYQTQHQGLSPSELVHLLSSHYPAACVPHPVRAPRVHQLHREGHTLY